MESSPTPPIPNSDFNLTGRDISSIGLAQCVDLIERFKGGATVNVLQAEFGVSAALVYRILRNYEFNGKKPYRHYRGAVCLSLDQRFDIIQKSKSGATVKALAAEYGVASTTVYRILQNEVDVVTRWAQQGDDDEGVVHTPHHPSKGEIPTQVATATPLPLQQTASIQQPRKMQSVLLPLPSGCRTSQPQLNTTNTIPEIAPRATLPQSVSTASPAVMEVRNSLSALPPSSLQPGSTSTTSMSNSSSGTVIGESRLTSCTDSSDEEDVDRMMPSSTESTNSTTEVHLLRQKQPTGVDNQVENMAALPTKPRSCRKVEATASSQEKTITDAIIAYSSSVQEQMTDYDFSTLFGESFYLISLECSDVDDGYSAKLRLPCGTYEEVNRWSLKFQERSGTDFSFGYKHKTPGGNTGGLLYYTQYCQHGHRLSEFGCSAHGSGRKKIGCEASIKFYIRESSSYSEKDPCAKILKKFPTYVELNIHHNHKPTQAELLKYRKPTASTKSAFIELFDAGHTVAAARKMRYKELMAKAEEEGKDSFLLTTDASLYPSANYVYRLYRRHKKMKHGGQTGHDQPMKMAELVNSKDPNITNIDKHQFVGTIATRGRQSKRKPQRPCLGNGNSAERDEKPVHPPHDKGAGQERLDDDWTPCEEESTEVSSFPWFPAAAGDIFQFLKEFGKKPKLGEEDFDKMIQVLRLWIENLVLLKVKALSNTNNTTKSKKDFKKADEVRPQKDAVMSCETNCSVSPLACHDYPPGTTGSHHPTLEECSSQSNKETTTTCLPVVTAACVQMVALEREEDPTVSAPSLSSSSPSCSTYNNPGSGGRTQAGHFPHAGTPCREIETHTREPSQHTAYSTCDSDGGGLRLHLTRDDCDGARNMEQRYFKSKQKVRRNEKSAGEDGSTIVICDDRQLISTTDVKRAGSKVIPKSELTHKAVKHRERRQQSPSSQDKTIPLQTKKVVLNASTRSLLKRKGYNMNRSKEIVTLKRTKPSNPQINRNETSGGRKVPNSDHC